MVFLARLYARRIVNINVNIILAGTLAMGLTLIPVYFSRRFTDHKATIMAVTFLSDIIFDVVIYYALHWLANHMPKRRRQPGVAIADLSFLKDASLVQFERALLAPVYYGVAMSTQYLLLHPHTTGPLASFIRLLTGQPPDVPAVFSREAATATALMFGIMSTRILHTIWMVRQERRRDRAAALKARAGGVHAVDNGQLLASEQTVSDPPTPEELRRMAIAADRKVGAPP
ncbi:MAG: hypothetical protein IT436_09145 [Phycisphaerales bacterium]|nr:hypothetical protein [Phycisphaerales bacterium]